MTTATEIVPREVSVSALAALNREEVDLQISTAKKFPRDVERFYPSATAMVTVTPEFAGMCVYSIPRGGKIIEGPSVRFAECIAHAWGNCRVAARVIEEGATAVVAQGMCADLESNWAVTFEVKRRITDRDGNRYNADMVTTTGNAACAIALRNAILRVVPRAFWDGIYKQVRAVIAGKEPSDVARRREVAIQYLGSKYQITPEQICQILKIKKVEEIGADELVTLRGLCTALDDGDITIDEAVRHAKPIPQMPKRKNEKKAKSNSKPVSRAKKRAATPRQETADAAPSSPGAPNAEKAATPSATELLTSAEAENIFRQAHKVAGGYDQMMELLKTKLYPKYGIEKAWQLPRVKLDDFMRDLKEAGK